MAEPDPPPPTDLAPSAMNTTGGASAPPNDIPSAQAPVAAPPPPPPPPVVPQAAVNLGHQALHAKGQMCSDCTDRRWFDCDYASRNVGQNGVQPPCSNCRYHGGSRAVCQKGGSLHDSLFVQARRGPSGGLPAPKLRTNDPMQSAPTNWQGNPNPVGQLQLPPNLQGPNLIARLGLTLPVRPIPTPRSTLPDRGQGSPTWSPAQANPRAVDSQPQTNWSYQYPAMNGYGLSATPQLGFSFHFSLLGQGRAAQGQGMQGQDVTMNAQFPQQYQGPQQQTMPQYGLPHGHRQNMQHFGPQYVQQYGPQHPQQIWQQPQMPPQDRIALPPLRQSPSLSPRSTGYLSPSDGFPPPSSPRSMGYLSPSEGSPSPEQHADRDEGEMLPPSRADSGNRIDGRLDNATGGVSLPHQGPGGFGIRGHAALEHAGVGNQGTVPGQKRNAEEDAAEQDSPKRQKPNATTSQAGGNDTEPTGSHSDHESHQSHGD